MKLMQWGIRKNEKETEMIFQDKVNELKGKAVTKAVQSKVSSAISWLNDHPTERMIFEVAVVGIGLSLLNKRNSKSSPVQVIIVK